MDGIAEARDLIVQLGVVVLLAFLAGCRGPNTEGVSPHHITEGADGRGEASTAVLHNATALEHIGRGEYSLAERELAVALSADPSCGPAHNNLGTVYLQRRDYYRAAWQFQYAAKLLPAAPQPCCNLGMVFEAVGNLSKAAEWYEKANAMDPDDIRVVGSLTRVYVRQGRRDERTRQLLQEVVMRTQSPIWREWAREQLALLGPKAAGPATRQDESRGGRE